MPKLPTEDDLSGRGQRLLTTGGGASTYRVERPDTTRPDMLRAEALNKLGTVMGQTSDQIATELVKERERNDTLRAEEAFNQLRTSQIDLTLGPENGFTQRRGGDAVNQPILEQWTKHFNERSKQIEDGLANDQQRERYRRRSGVALAQFQGNILEHRAREYDSYAKNIYQTTLDTELRNIGAAPQDDLGVGLSMQRITVGADQEAKRLGLDPAAAQTKAVDAAWVHRLEAWRLRDPVGALANFQANQLTLSADVRIKVAEGLYRDAEPVLARDLNAAGGVTQLRDKLLTMTPEEAAKIKTGNAVVDALPADQKLKVLRAADTLASQQNTQERQALELRYKDASAAFERGQTPPNMPTRVELHKVFGPVEGARLADNLSRMREFGENVRRVQGMSTTDQIALLTKTQPAPGDGYADAVVKWEALRGAVDRVTKDREQDPAKAVLATAPQVQSAYKNFVNQVAAGSTEVAGASQAYAATTLAEQKRLQIANPQVLSKEMVDAVSRRFFEPPKTGENFANIMRGMVEQWGQYWPTVGKQLNKSLPSEAVVMGLGVSAEAEQLLTETAKIKKEDLHSGLSQADLATLRDRIHMVFEPLRLSMPQVGGLETYDHYANSAEKMAITLVQRHGLKPKEAVDRTFAAMSGKRDADTREFVPFVYEGRWRIPQNRLGGATTVDALETGAKAIMRDIGSETSVLPRVELKVPKVEDPAVRPQDAEKQWRSDIRANGFWVTSPGDEGLTLYVKSGLGAQIVQDSLGRPITRSWRDLSAVGNSAPAAIYGRDVPVRRK